MRPVGINTARWRYPGAYPDANFNLKHLVRFIQTLEQARFDAYFMADHLAVLNVPGANILVCHGRKTILPAPVTDVVQKARVPGCIEDHPKRAGQERPVFRVPLHVRSGTNSRH
jgi:hypothetical protein